MASSFNQYTLANNQQFKARVEMKLLRHAMYLLTPPDPAPSPEETALAQRVLGVNAGGPGGGTSQYADRMARIAAQEPSLDTKVRDDVSGALITDLDLESVVATHFLKLA